jgi:glycosyltransferase involved in cell wall biosynthesis
VVHEWFVNYAGSEKVVEQILNVYPQADLFAVVDFLPDTQRAFLGGRKAQTSFIQRLPKARSAFRNYLPLMPLAVEQFDLSGYDLVISSNHAVAKGVLTGPGQVHVSYVHSPMRYAWDLQHQYLSESGLRSGIRSGIARLCLHYLRLWDSRTACGVDTFIANSRYIARRIRKTYGRDAEVVYPPVDVQRFTVRADKEDFYLAASRMVPYKRMPVIVEAFTRMRSKRLVVIGDGPEFARVNAMAAGSHNIRVLGFTPADVLADYLARARALIFAAEEDFGITPVEAQACGTPVIAYGAGGALESVVCCDKPDRRTGLFFSEQTAQSVCNAVAEFEMAGEFNAQTCRINAERFSIEKFRNTFSGAVRASLAAESVRRA